MVCPNLHNLDITGNPLVERFPRAPPKVKAILMNRLKISIDCERSDVWCKGVVKRQKVIGVRRPFASPVR